MATFSPALDFDVIREIWNKYELADNTFLKVKVVLERVKKKGAAQTIGQATDPAKQNFDLDLQNHIVVLTNEQGPPDPRNYTQDELQKAVVKDEIRYTSVTQDWNEYVVDDGTRIRIQPIIMRVAKTSKFTAKGYPVYWVDLNLTVQVKPPAASTSPTT